MDIRGTINALVESGQIDNLVNNPLAQFGPQDVPYLGATVLPEQTVPQNAYREEDIQYRSVIANDSTRYSPVQKKRGVFAGYMDVRLGEQDIGSDFTASDYDAFIQLLQAADQGGADMEMRAMLSLLNFVELTLDRPLRHKIEKMRWEAIEKAQVILTGDNNYREVVDYPNPTGHRVAVGGDWSDDTYNLYADITKGVDFLASKGYTANRIITSSPVMATIANNDLMKSRAGRITVAAGTVVGLPGRVSRADINGILNEDGVPAPETNDAQYRTQTGSGFYISRTVMIMLGTTGRDKTVNALSTVEDALPIRVPNSLGYVGVGRPAGMSGPGRRVLLTPFENKPPRIEGEAWQTTFPVIQDPEAIYVITGINTAYD